MLIFSKKINKIDKKLNKILRRLSQKENNDNNESKKDFFSMIWKNFLLGISKGLGTAIGFTILGAIIVYLLKKVLLLNLPVIGAFFRDLMQIIEDFENAK